MVTLTVCFPIHSKQWTPNNETTIINVNNFTNPMAIETREPRLGLSLAPFLVLFVQWSVSNIHLFFTDSFIQSMSICPYKRSNFYQFVFRNVTTKTKPDVLAFPSIHSHLLCKVWKNTHAIRTHWPLQRDSVYKGNKTAEDPLDVQRTAGRLSNWRSL